MKNKIRKVLILTGPGGSGKTTIANLLAEKYGFIKIDGDNLDTKFFPDEGQWLSENFKKLQQAHNYILSEVKKAFKGDRNNIVLDYIIFGDYLKFFEKFRSEFGNKLEIRVLFPKLEEVIKRDKERDCWTTGTERIKFVYSEFESIKDKIGIKNFIDTSGKTPNETIEKYFNYN